MRAKGSEKMVETSIESHDLEDDALSFCDLPIAGEGACDELSKNHPTEASHQEHDRFEFFKDIETEMSAAEDIFFRGQILPLKSSSSSSSSSSSGRVSRNGTEKRDFVKRRSGSMDEPSYVSYFSSSQSSSDSSRGSSRSSSTGKLRTHHYSFGSPKLQRIPRLDSKVKKVAGDYDIRARRPSQVRPKWHDFVFGMKKLPEMEMTDIRNRQRRRNPENDGGRQMVSDSNRGESRSPWKLLRGLSCKGNADVMVTGYLGCVPHV